MIYLERFVLWRSVLERDCIMIFLILVFVFEIGWSGVAGQLESAGN